MFGSSGLLDSPILCLVTDRRVLVGSSPGAGDPSRLLIEQIAAAAQAGVSLIQVRERDLEASALARLVREAVGACEGTRTRIVVNDRLDVALVAGAAGVHLRGDSISARDARRLAPPGFIVGRSVRSAEQAGEVARAGGVDYLVLGTVFATPSKPGGETIVGLEELKRAVAASPVPVLGIGGISDATLADVARTGAAGVAAIRLFVPASNDFRSLHGAVQKWRAVFDSQRLIP